MAVLLADRFRADEALAETLCQNRQGNRDARLVARDRFDRVGEPSCQPLPHSGFAVHEAP